VAVLKFRRADGQWEALGQTVSGVLDDLGDVQAAAPVEGHGITWSAGAGAWIGGPVWRAWTGSQAAYDALPTKDPNTLFVIV